MASKTVERLIDTETGEILSQTVISNLPKTQTPYWRLTKFFASTYFLSVNSQAKASLMAYFVRNLDYRDNSVEGTFDEFSACTGIPRRTVARAMADYQRENIVKQVRHGKWMLNPSCICYGEEQMYQNLCAAYSHLDDRTKTRRERLHEHGDEPGRNVDAQDAKDDGDNDANV